MVNIGYIYTEKNFSKDEKAFLRQAKRRKAKLIMFNTSEDIDEDEIKAKAKECDIIFNNTAEKFSVEFIKTLEELGKKVIEPSRTYYYIEDKWMFYLECEKNKILCPKTILLSENLNLIKKDLKKFNNWPVILKKIEGCCGESVEKAEDTPSAIEVIKRFWGNNEEKVPIIAQEYIHSPSYRVTVIDGKIVQTALKENKGWKCTGVYEKKFKKFPVGKDLKNIIKKVIDVVKINVCGIDLLKKNNYWYVLEVNSSPAFDFFEDEREMLVGKVINMLIKKTMHHP